MKFQRKSKRVKKVKESINYNMKKMKAYQDLNHTKLDELKNSNDEVGYNFAKGLYKGTVTLYAEKLMSLDLKLKRLLK